MTERLKKQFILMTLVALALQVLTVQISTALAFSGGEVMINEIAWSGGRDNSGDEWIELYNTTNQTIDLSGWYIVDDVDTLYTIENGEIPPHGYFLIEDNENVVSNVVADAVIGLSLANAGDSLALNDSAGVVIDRVNANGGAWYAGDLVNKSTMERIDPSVSLDIAENWASALSGNGSVGSAGSPIFGTPGTVNSNYGGGGPEVALNPPQASAKLGDFVTFSVEISGSVDLYAYGFDVDYDPLVLSFVSAKEGGFLKIDGASTAFNTAVEDGVEGTVVIGNARLVNPPAGIDGGGELLSLTFEVINENDTEISFGAASFLADSSGDIATSYGSANLNIGGVDVGAIGNLQISSGAKRFSLELSWDAPFGGAGSYIVKRQMVDGSFVTLGETVDTSFVDDDSIVNGGNLLPTIANTYRIIAVRNGVQGVAVEVVGTENRGIVGDNDRNDRVDGRDIEKLARSYGSEYSDEEYDPLTDANFDGVIDGNDLINIGANFGLVY